MMPPNKPNRVSSRLLLAALTLSLAISFSSPTQAQRNGAGITVTPVKDEFLIKPGQSVTRSVRVINPVAEPITLYPRVLNFSTDNDKGQPVFYSLAERSSTYALSDWVKTSKPFLRISPNEEEKFEITITAPENAEPGGHYGAILFSTEEPKLDEDVSQIGVVGLVGTLLLITVPGDITEKLVLADYDAPTILFRAPANFSLKLENVGNIHAKPVGEIKLRNWSGNVVQTLKVNDGGGNVLPDSFRRFESSWSFDWKAIGRFRATALLTYGQPEQQIVAERAFYIIPVWLLIALASLILIIVLLIIIRRRRAAFKKNYRNSLPNNPPQRRVRPILR